MQKYALRVAEPLVCYKLSRVALGTRVSHFVIKLSHFVTPVPVQPCLGDRMQDFSVHAGNKYLPKVKNPSTLEARSEERALAFFRKLVQENGSGRVSEYIWAKSLEQGIKITDPS